MKLNVGHAIRFIRQSKGMSQGDIAKQNGWERSYVSDLERGVIRNPSLETILLLIKALGVTCNDFIRIAYGSLSQGPEPEGAEAMAFVSKEKTRNGGDHPGNSEDNGALSEE